MPKSQQWTLWSTRETINDDVPSVTAVLETVIAATVFCSAALYFDTYLILLPGVFVAPLVLLRSDQSVKQGVDWFTNWEARIGEQQHKTGTADDRWTRKILAIGIIGLKAFLGFAIAYVLARALLVEMEGWKVFLGSLVISWVAVALATGVFAVASAFTKVIVWGETELTGVGGSQLAEGIGATTGTLVVTGAVLLSIPGAIIGGSIGLLTGQRIRGVGGAKAVIAAAALGVTVVLAGIAVWGPIGIAAGIAVGPTVYGSALGVFLVGVAIRIAATVCHLWSGIKAFPTNFRRLVFCTSPIQAPEFVPGLVEGQTRFTIGNLWKEFRRQNDLLGQLIYLVLMGAWFFPAWLYRFILKSMFWFWWPVAFVGGYIGGPPKRAADPELYIQEVMQSKMQRLLRLTAWLSVILFCIVNGAYFLYSLWDAEGAQALLQPLPIFAVMFLIFGLETVPTWQLAGALTPVTKLAHWYVIQAASIRWRYGRKYSSLAAENSGRRKIVAAERVARAGLVFFVIYWAGAAALFVLLTNHQRCWFTPPTKIQVVATFFYGKYTPPTECRSTSRFPVR